MKNEKFPPEADQPLAGKIMECPFCNLKEKRILKKGKYCAVILSNPKLVEGHLLVVPLRHAERLTELELGEREELFETVVEFQEKILDKVASGCDIRQNCRPFQKQSRLKVDHLHFHLQPRELFDDLYEKCQIYETEIFRKLEQKETDKFIKLLK